MSARDKFLEARDPALGRALHAFDPPHHGPAYWHQIDAALAAETAAVPRPWYRRRPLMLAAAGAAAAAVVLALVLIGLPGVKQATPATATAAEIVASMDHAGQTLATVTAEVVSMYFPRDGDPAHVLTLRRYIVIDTEGNWLCTLTDEADPEKTVEGTLFDARALQWGEWRAPGAWDGTSEVRGLLYTHVPAGLGIGPRSENPELATISLVRALLAGSDALAESVTYLDRDAWHLELAVPRADGGLRHPDRIDLTIDKQTGYPLETVEWRGDTKDSESRVVSFEVGAAAAQDESAMFESIEKAIKNPYESPTTSASSDLGCQRAPLESFVDLIGRPAIVAGWMPDGFVFADATAMTASWISDDPETSVVYRGGLCTFAVDSYPLSRLGTMGDPIGQQSELNGEVVKLTRGLFKGLKAHIVIDVRTRYTAPHLWLRDKKRDLAVVVLGDLSRNEFVAVAESLKEGPE
jgi:hypothetical protein